MKIKLKVEVEFDSPEEAYNYAKKKGERVPELEPLIAKNALNSFYYACYVLKGRFPLGEVAIAQSAELSYSYARNILKGRFELGEKEISKSAFRSYYYARDVIKGRFELGEKVINNSYTFKHKYNDLLTTFS